MARRRGLQAEVLLSLSLVMLTATGVLGLVLLRTHQSHVLQLRRLAARSLAIDAESPLPGLSGDLPAMRWWIVNPQGSERARGSHAEPMDAPSRALADEARDRDLPLLRSGAPWQPLRFAAPTGTAGTVAVAWLPPSVSGAFILILMLGDVAVFTAFGAYLFRRRLIRPLERLAATARAIADGNTLLRAPVEGSDETCEVALAFNEMTEALDGHSRDLEKAVGELRESNRSLREARAGLDRAERLAAVGRLAAGVAHEVGNPMGAMLAFLDLTKRDEGLSEKGRGYLSRAAREGERVREILRQLLDFSRPPRGKRLPVDLRALCEETASLVRAQSRYAAIEIAVEAQGEPPRALADPSGVVQILLNLLINAADALCGGTPQPRIDVIVRPAVRERRAQDASEAAAECRRFDGVECLVRDNGPGVADEDRERIFDPFFTTKDPGEGTGLGLSNAARFAEEFGGNLELVDEPTRPGATLRLCLPCAPASDADELAGSRVRIRA